MTSFAAAQRMITAEQTEALPILPRSKQHIANKLFRTMADVCEAFCFFRVFSGLQKIRVICVICGFHKLKFGCG